MNGVEPELERSARLLERRSHGRVEVMTAPLARIGALGFDPVPVGRALARRARKAPAEPHIEQVSEARLVIRKLLEESGSGKRLRHARSYATIALRMREG